MSGGPPTGRHTVPGGAAGLSDAEVDARLKAGLGNAVVYDSSRSLWNILRTNVVTLFNAVVGGSFLLLLALGYGSDALFGLAALGNIVIGVLQEYKAKRSLDRLAILHLPTARVLRDGQVRIIGLESVVRDDILLLRAGDQVAADAVLLEGRGLEVDESLLTGESEPVAKLPDMEVLSGSIIVAGNGTARAVRVGAGSFANRLTAEAKRFSLVSSEIRAGINKVLRWVSWALFPVIALIVNGQMQAHGGWEQAAASGAWKTASVGAIAGVIAMIPLGLVLLTSIAFAVGAVRLSRLQVLMQEIAAVEGLARVDVLCLDKTGTLTQGRIVFDAVHDAGRAAAPGWEAALGWFGADPDANATARCLRPAFPAEAWPGPASRVPFSSESKWSSLTFAPDHVAPGTWILGAPEMVLAGGGATAAPALERAAALASAGLRTLVLAHAPGPGGLPTDGTPALPNAVEPVVLLTFREELREDVDLILAFFAQEGVSLRILSGDDPRTVARVARDVGLDAGSGYDASRLPADPRMLEEVMESTTVFGRVGPAQKREMVKALERRGHTVAMVGDGVNDALALKEASIGIAMDSASPATKAVARLVLLDGRFDRLPAVLAEGRRVIANVERVSVLFLSKTSYAFILSVAFGVLAWEFPFLPRQLSVTDGLTIGIPAFFLALMPNQRRYAPGFLRRSLLLAVPAGAVVAAVILGINAFAVLGGYPDGSRQTASIVALCVVGLCILAVVSRPVNRGRGGVIAAMAIALAVVLTWPFFQEFLALAWPPLELVAVATAAAAAGAGVLAILARVPGSGTTRRRRKPRAARPSPPRRPGPLPGARDGASRSSVKDGPLP